MKLIQANGCVMWSLVFLSSAKVNCLLYSLELFGLELNLHFSALHFMFRNYWLPFLLQEFWKCSVSAIPFFMIYFLVSFKEVVWIFAKDFFYALDSLFERSPVCLHCFYMLLLYIIWRRLLEIVGWLVKSLVIIWMLFCNRYLTMSGRVYLELELFEMHSFAMEIKIAVKGL